MRDLERWVGGLSGHGSEGLHEMRGLEGEGCLVAWVKGIT